MLFNPQNQYDIQKADEYYKKLRNGDEPFEITRKSKKRALSQNAYLHLILGFFSCEYGCSVAEAKVDFFKRDVNLSIFCPNGERRKDGKPKLRSSADLTTAEMTIAIERFRNWSISVAGIYLPSPNEHQFLIYAEQEMQRNQEFI